MFKNVFPTLFKALAMLPNVFLIDKISSWSATQDAKKLSLIEATDD